jgi:hypothetical protein
LLINRPATATVSPSRVSPSGISLNFWMNKGRDVSTWNLCGYGVSPFSLRAKILLIRFAVYCVASSSPSSSSSDFFFSTFGAAAAAAAFFASFSAFAFAVAAAFRRFLYSLR